MQSPIANKKPFLQLGFAVLVGLLLTATGYAQTTAAGDGADESSVRKPLEMQSRDATGMAPAADNVFKFAVLSDPQAFRLPNDVGDPNDESKNGDAWRIINDRLVTAINKVGGIEFGIVNGDITEFGRNNSWNNFASTYNRLYFPYYIGLGNHDYQNNVDNCTEGIVFPSADSCAFNSLNRMNNALHNYSSTLAQFSTDWITTSPSHWTGSMSYSWDYKDVHFVQLQNFPSYHVALTAWTERYAWVSSSISWLREDLRLARLRGKKDIIINFHQDDHNFPPWTDDYNTRQFRAIIDTFKPLAIFTGHRHVFTKVQYIDHALFGNVTVFRSGAALNGEVSIVTYDNGKLIVTNNDSASGTLKETVRHESPAVEALPICLTPGSFGIVGSLYVTPLIPESHWNLRQVRTSQKNLDASANGEGYLRSWTDGNPYQLWTFEKAYAGWPEFNSWYIIKQSATGRVLDSNAKGEVYTNYPTPGNGYQQWWPIKTEHGEIQLRNRLTGRFLQGSDTLLFTDFGYETFNLSKVWQFVHGWNHSRPDNSRFFKALTSDAYRSSFPEGTKSDANWAYLGTLDVLKQTPCVGW